MNDDIVVRLRTLTNTLLLGDFQGLAATTASAADEIERLQDKCDSLLSTNVELEVRIKSIKEGFEGCCTACEPVGEINNKLREERDEARRRLCAELLEVEGHPCGWKGARGAEGIAERFGWDCFKENTDE